MKVMNVLATFFSINGLPETMNAIDELLLTIRPIQTHYFDVPLHQTRAYFEALVKGTS
jgi:hypothetical protein